jgi:ribosomal protein L37E
MQKYNRVHVPCRVCGNKHTNRASSSICSPCGIQQQLAKRHAERVEKVMIKAQEDANVRYVLSRIATLRQRIDPDIYELISLLIEVKANG